MKASERTVTYDLPGLGLVQLLCDGEGRPRDVIFGAQQQMAALDIERMAALIRDGRHRAGDTQEVCPEHGRHDGYACKECNAGKPA